MLLEELCALNAERMLQNTSWCLEQCHSLPSLGLQGPSDENAFTPQRPTSNGNYGTPGGNAFATPASMTSQHSIEDEETLLLDPQVTLLTCQPTPLTAASDGCH